MKKNPIDAILDPKDNGPVTLYDAHDNGIEFEQICLIPIKKQIYCILRPVEKMKGLADDEALVFQIHSGEDREDSLILITNQKIIDAVFNEYYKLLEKNSD